MPTYDYRCERTGEMFELWQSFSDDALTECPETHDGESDVCSSPVRKVFSKVGISFKGDGFYKNDHGGGGSKGAASESSESKSSDSKSSDSKSSDNKSSDNKSSDNKSSSGDSSSSSTSSKSDSSSPKSSTDSSKSSSD